MTTYRIQAEAVANGVLLRLAFGEPAQNDQIVRDAVESLESLALTGGKTVYLNGPASLPVAVAIAHGVAHKFGEVAVYDPKLGGYVVAVSHGGRAIGTLVNPE